MRSDMASDWRTVQLFLSQRQPAIYEVEINLDGPGARCTCPSYKGRRSCRHTKFVADKMQDNGGHYPLLVRESAEEEDISSVMSSPEAFRDFVVRYGKVEVL